jgi:hypothetical protein
MRERNVLNEQPPSGFMDRVVATRYLLYQRFWERTLIGLIRGTAPIQLASENEQTLKWFTEAVHGCQACRKKSVNSGLGFPVLQRVTVTRRA